MKLIILLPVRQFEKLLGRMRYRLVGSDGISLMNEGYDCIEEKTLIFIHAKQPADKKSPDYNYWIKVFGDKMVREGRITYRKDKIFLNILIGGK